MSELKNNLSQAALRGRQLLSECERNPLYRIELRYAEIGQTDNYEKYLGLANAIIDRLPKLIEQAIIDKQEDATLLEMISRCRFEDGHHVLSNEYEIFVCILRREGIQVCVECDTNPRFLKISIPVAQF